MKKMDIQAEKFNIVMTYDELWSVAFDTKRAIEYSLETHWVNHQNAWKTNEDVRLARLRTFFSALGRLDLYEDVLSFATKTFEAWNKKHNKEQ
jgi:hypothetical protein